MTLNYLQFDNLSLLQLVFIVVVTFILVVSLIYELQMFNKNSLKQVIRYSREISVKRFLRLRNVKDRNKRLKSFKQDVEGVYIIHNHTEGKYYVGQAQHMISRVNNHFTGKGNGRIYADYDHGDRFTVRFVALKGSGFKNLNDLERYFIEKYDALEAGYNRTKGNK